MKREGEKGRRKIVYRYYYVYLDYYAYYGYLIKIIDNKYPRIMIINL